jgi:aspartyl-tRNA(Asn)/glutamyl-tRNA(Gln) amidotransferase subunit A
MWSVLRGKPVPEPRLAGVTVGVLTRPPSVGDSDRPAENLAAEQYVATLEGLGARCVSAEIPDPEANTWPVFFHEAVASHRSTFPARADDYGDNVRTKLQLAQSVNPDAVAAGYRALELWRRYEPDVDLFVAPVLGIDLPPEDCDELDVRIPFTAFARPFNLLGWAGLAIGDLQLIAPDDEAVLAAGLALERA